MSSSSLGALSEDLVEERNCIDKFFLTTAISYTNGYPHIGHAYEFITADVLVRFYRVLGYKTFFLTGSDEHGQKVAASAEKAGRRPIEHCDLFVEAFKNLDKQLLISYNRYIRTTDSDHISYSQRLWKLCSLEDDIYLGSYEGWYNEREECFVSDADAEVNKFIDPDSGLPLKRIVEESYFFRMSSFCDKLIGHIEANPNFIQPDQFKNNILHRLKSEGLKDLSISRTSFTWGIPVPDGFDKKHVMYVWFDALTNYLTGVDALNVDNEFHKFWPPNIQIIGKDIIWFHCVIWPCILMSAKLTLPECIFSHGFVNASDGKKMSKSLGNSIDPISMMEKFNVDAIRYYLCASVTYGADINFSENSLVTMHNSELADIIGNLVNRALNLCLKYCDGIIPDTEHDEKFSSPFDFNTLRQEVENDIKKNFIHLAVFRAMEAARSTNRFLTEAEPWKMKGSDISRRPAIVRTTLEGIYAFTHFLAPIIPLAADAIFQKLHSKPRPIFDLKDNFYNLIPGTKVEVGTILFSKIESEPIHSPIAIVKPILDHNQSDFSKLDIRIGKIVRVWHHDSADKLFCVEVDIGENIPRNIASGLRHYYSLKDLENRKVIVLCNIKEVKLVGFLSCGMLLTAKNLEGQVELLEPTADSIIGEKLYVNEDISEPWDSAKVKKFKIWEKVLPDLQINSDKIACWKGIELQSSKGVCRVQTLRNAQIN